MSFWTLEYDGDEQSFQAWGFTDPKLSPKKLAVTTFKVRIPGATNLVSDPPIPFKGQVIIRRNRAAVDGGGFSGGEIVFQGRQITDQRIASMTPADVLTFGDAWWDLENLVFQQQWKTWDNGLHSDAIMPFCQVNLFQDFTTGYVITNGAQVEEIIAWAVTCGVAIQAGTIDLAWYIQPYPASALSCASAIQVCLKPSPGACCYLDMSTTPPTFNRQDRSYHTALSLPYASGSHKSSELIPRYDMQVPQVVLQYRQGVQVTIGGQSQSWTNMAYDAWPLDATLAVGVRGGKQVGAMVVPIQLADFQRTDLVQKVTAAAFGDPPSLDWWKSKKRAMADYTDLAYVSGSLKILDASGTDITGTVLASYPNELLDGQVTTWMKDDTGTAIGVQTVTVQGAYLMCHTWDGTTEGATDTYVAKPFELRHSITTETIEGTEVDYTYMTRPNNLDGQREAIANPDTVPSSAQVEIVLRVYLVDDEILVTTPAGGTGVVVDSVAVTLEDLNVGARAWCQVD